MNETNILMPSLSEQDVFLTRVLNAPIDLVWKAYSEAEHLAHWWGPKGCQTQVLSLDFRPSGLFHYAMETPSGAMYGRFIYQDIVPQERISFVLSFADAEANIVRAPFSETWPLEMLSEVVFTAQDGKTLLTMAAKPINACAEEMEAFKQGRAGLQAGTNASLDELAEYLATQ